MSHSRVVAYIMWVFGFMGMHRFYTGKQTSGFIWLCSFGLLGVGWLLDIFLIPSMVDEANSQYKEGVLSYDISWLLLTFLGVFGAHRIYLRKWPTAILYFFTAGLFGIGIFYDLWTLNDQIDNYNRVSH